MSKDYSAEIAELSAALTANRVARATIKAEVRARHRALIDQEIKELTLATDKKFAQVLADVKARSGIPLSVIQDEVLRTRSWHVYTKWRDLAEIPTSRELADKIREETAAFRWSEDLSTLTVLKTSTGAEIEPLTYEGLPGALKRVDGHWWPNATNEEEEFRVIRDDPGYVAALSAEIVRVGEENPEWWMKGS